MSDKEIANATAAWVNAWMFGNAQPRVVLNAFDQLFARCPVDQPARAILDKGLRVIAATPFGSVSESSVV